MTFDGSALTRKLLSFNTIDPPGDERDCAQFLGRLLETTGYQIRYYEFAEKRSTLIAASYFTDCSVFTPAYGNPPTIVLGPGESDMAHKTDEYCCPSKIDLAAGAYLAIAQRWCGI